MQPRSWQLRIEDILEAIAKIDRYTKDMTFEGFSQDEKTVDAVIRNIEVIGEAVGRVPSEVQERHPHIPWAEMRGIRNVLIHEYFRVSLPILWHTVTQNLTPLPPLLRDLLEREK